MKRRRILVASFGTTVKEARDASIGAIEQAVAAAFAKDEVERCFTSEMVIKAIQKREGVRIDNPLQAMEKAEKDGVQELLILPTHLMGGLEYQKLEAAAKESAGRFRHIVLARPLLSEKKDFEEVLDAIRDSIRPWLEQKTAVVLVGHGSKDKADAVYANMQATARELGLVDYYVGTIESQPGPDLILKQLQQKDYTKIILVPFLLVAGDHALNDIAGEEHSWKQILEKAGYEVIPIRKGLGEVPDVQQIYVRHLMRALKSCPLPNIPAVLL